MFKITQKISLFALFIYVVICVLLILLFKSIIPGVAGVFVGYCVFVIVLLMQQYLHRRTFRQGIIFNPHSVAQSGEVIEIDIVFEPASGEEIFQEYTFTVENVVKRSVDLFSKNISFFSRT